MVGETGRHSWRALNPSLSLRGDPERQAQTVVRGAEVVDGAQNHHAVMKRSLSVSQMTRAARQTGEPLSESGVEALNVGGVDDGPAV